MRIARIGLSFGVLLWCCGLCLHGFAETDDVLHEIANLRDPAWGIRRAAVINLGQMGDRRAVPALLAALNGMDPRLQNFAVRSLAQLKDPRAIEPLIVLANKNANKEVADVATQALGQFKDARAIAALIGILRQSGQDDTTVASALGRIGAPAVPPLLAALKTAGPADRVRLLDALGWMNNAQATNVLIGFLNNPDPSVRKAVVTGLGGHWDSPGKLAPPFDVRALTKFVRQAASPLPKDPRVPGLLISALQDSDAGVQTAAAFGLASLKLAAAVEPLVGLLRKPVDSSLSAPEKMEQASLRKSVAFALGEIGDARAADALIAALKDPDDAVRSFSARSLGQIKDQRATEALVSLVNDKSNGVRNQALTSLAQIKDPRAVRPLIEAMRKESAEVEARSGAGMPEDMRAQMTRTAVMTDPILQGAPYALKQIGKPATASLIAAMDSTDPVFRQRILAALNASEDASAVDAIVAALRDTDAGVRSAALSALAGAHDPGAAAPFKNAWMMSDATARYDAVSVLCRNDAAWATAQVIEAMKQKDSGFAARCIQIPVQLKASIAGAVIPLLTDPDNDTRQIAARTLAALVPNPLFDEPSADGTETRAEIALHQSLKDRNMVAICAATSYYVGRGETGSEDTLIDALNAAGEDWVAQYFLVSGNKKLEIAGRAWLIAHHRSVDSEIYGPMWGQLRPKPAS